jgi:hypothetical protein
MENPDSVQNAATQRHGWAWVGLCAALAIHIADEALTDFLSVYNPSVRAIRRQLPFLPLPTFTFGAWLGGLVTAVVLLLVLSRLVFRGARWMVPLSYIFGVLMLANGVVHCASSIYFRRLMPGVYSAPLLLAASVYLLVAARQRRRAAQAAPTSSR